MWADIVLSGLYLYNIPLLASPGGRPRLSARPSQLRSAIASLRCRRLRRRAAKAVAPCLRHGSLFAAFGRRTHSFVTLPRYRSVCCLTTVFAARVGLTPDMELCSKPRKGSALDPQTFFEEKSLTKNLFVFMFFIGLCLFKATPHEDCAQIAQSAFSSDRTDFPKEYYRISRKKCVI